MPRLLSSAGRYAFINSWRIVTNEAMTTMNAGILTLSGTRFLIAEIAQLLHTRTDVVASPMLNAVIALPVVPRVGQSPRSKTKVGFSLIIPLNIVSVNFMILLLNINLKSLVSVVKRSKKGP